MQRPGDRMGDNDVPRHDAAAGAAHAPSSAAAQARPPMMPARSRSMSDSGGRGPLAKLLSPSPHIVETAAAAAAAASARASKDDSTIPASAAAAPEPPVTPRRPSFARASAGLGLQTNVFSAAAAAAAASSSSSSINNTNNNYSNSIHHPQFTPPAAASSSSSSHAGVRPAPLSPKPDHPQIYASPTNLLPRRSRGLDFSRAATSLHHSILAEQPSPGSSPLVSGCGWTINMPGFAAGGPEQSSTSLWSIMGNQEKMNMSASLGSAHGPGSDLSSSSSSSDDDLMDEDADADADASFVTTPHISDKTAAAGGPSSSSAAAVPFDSPARTSGFPSFSQRQRHHRKVPKKKARVPPGLGGFNLATAAGYSPSNGAAAAAAASRARRESISWQANQLQISSSSGEADEPARRASDADGQAGDPRGVVRRVVTRRGNLLPKSKNFARIRAALAEECSPAEADFMREAEIVKQVRESDMDLEPRPAAGAVAEQHLPGTAAPAATPTATAQSSPNLLSHESSMEDMGPLGIANFKHQAMRNSKGSKKFWDTFSESSSMGGARTPPPPPAFPPPGRGGSSSGMSEDTTMESPSLPSYATFAALHGAPPTAAEITRRINSKRRREDDLDPGSFKRRAVSPSMSVHGSPVVQSPLQRDSVSFGSRPGSTSGDRGSSGHSEAGSVGGTPAFPPWGATGQVNRKGRVGLQGMVDTNDGIMRMSIE